MKKIIRLSSVVLLLLSSSAFCQNINLPADSVNAFLCKKWQLNYVEMGGMKMGKTPGAPTPDFEFNKGGTVSVSGSANTKRTAGTWSYDKNKKLIRLTLGTSAQRHLTIISLNESELIMLVDENQGVPGDVKELKMVYKLSSN